MAYICAECNEPINREEIEYFNGLPMHQGCKIANLINEGCSYKDALNELEHMGYDREEAIYLLKDYNF